jgi:hypothetical protein
MLRFAGEKGCSGAGVANIRGAATTNKRQRHAPYLAPNRPARKMPPLSSIVPIEAALEPVCGAEVLVSFREVEDAVAGLR